VTFDADGENPPDLQRQGWQATRDNFGRHVQIVCSQAGPFPPPNPGWRWRAGVSLLKVHIDIDFRGSTDYAPSGGRVA
jgi:hypothetical protein